MDTRKIRVSVQLEIDITGKEQRDALPSSPSGYSPKLRDVIQTAIREGRYELVGEQCIYTPAVRKFNQTYGTAYAEHPIHTRALKPKQAKPTEPKQKNKSKGKLKPYPTKYLLPEEELLNDIIDQFDQ